jgi:hypothetical protein
MSQKNNLLGNLFSSSPNFLSQLLFGILLGIIINLTGATVPVSVCLGILGGFLLGWFTAANESNTQPQNVASNDGIDAALKYWVFFLFGFILLGYHPVLSIFLGIIAAVGGGWIIAWWRSQEELNTQLPDEIVKEEEIPDTKERNQRKSMRRPTRRFRRSFGSNAPGNNPFKLW